MLSGTRRLSDSLTPPFPLRIEWRPNETSRIFYLKVFWDYCNSIYPTQWLIGDQLASWDCYVWNGDDVRRQEPCVT